MYEWYDKIYRDQKEEDPAFAEGYDVGYEDFKIGVLIKELRLKEGMTQEELAKRLHTKKSVISRMENHSEDIRLSTLERVAEVFGKRIQIAIKEWEKRRWMIVSWRMFPGVSRGFL